MSLRRCRPSTQATWRRANSGTSVHGTPADVSSGPPFFVDIKNPPSVWPRRADYRATRFVAERPHLLAGRAVLSPAGVTVQTRVQGRGDCLHFVKFSLQRVDASLQRERVEPPTRRRARGCILSFAVHTNDVLAVLDLPPGQPVLFPVLFRDLR